MKLKLSIGWIALFLVVAVVAAYFALGPVIGAHAAVAIPNVTWGR